VILRLLREPLLHKFVAVILQVFRVPVVNISMNEISLFPCDRCGEVVARRYIMTKNWYERIDGSAAEAGDLHFCYNCRDLARRVVHRERIFGKYWVPGQVSAICETRCWQWKGCRTPNGYGVFLFEGSTTTAHAASYRLRWTQYFERLPRGFEVHHRCRNRSCVNPDHLELVTRLFNVSQMFTKAAVQ
jgi:hypothetical protein